MCSKCENCELFVNLEEEKIRWYKILVSKNLKLHKKLTDQEEVIINLKNKLIEKRSNILFEHIIGLTEHTNNVNSSNHLENNVKHKLGEVNKLLEIFNSEKELFQQEVKGIQDHYFDCLDYLYGLVDYFRASLFDELDRSNKLKQYFMQQINSFTSTSHDIIQGTLKEESIRVNNELRLRYHKTIQKSKEEIERQNILVAKLRKHNKQLYLLICRNKINHEENIKNLERKLHNLKTAMVRLKEKNLYLQTQVKLKLEGCQNDIHDAKKTITKLKTHLV